MRCTILSWACLSLLVPTGAPAQDVDQALASVVRISGTRSETPVRGSGFVVAVDRDVATVVTASHVIEGARFEVQFAASATERFEVEAADVLGMESGDPNGLAVFQVRGAIPDGVAALAFDVESRPQAAEDLLLVGFPQRSRTPLAKRRTYSGRRGNLLLLDLPIGEGFSGGPVLRDGKVVGVVTGEDLQLTYAVIAVVAREFVAGSEVHRGGARLKPFERKLKPTTEATEATEAPLTRASSVAVVALDPDGRVDSRLAIGLVARLVEVGYVATSIDADEAELKALQRRELNNLRLSDGVDYLLLIDWDGMTFSDNPELADSITARATLAFEIYTAGGRLHFASVATEAGAGFSEDRAKTLAWSRTLDQLASQVRRQLP